MISDRNRAGEERARAFELRATREGFAVFLARPLAGRGRGSGAKRRTPFLESPGVKRQTGRRRAGGPLTSEINPWRSTHTDQQREINTWRSTGPSLVTRLLRRARRIGGGRTGPLVLRNVRDAAWSAPAYSEAVCWRVDPAAVTSARQVRGLIPPGISRGSAPLSRTPRPRGCYRGIQVAASGSPSVGPCRSRP